MKKFPFSCLLLCACSAPPSPLPIEMADGFVKMSLSNPSPDYMRAMAAPSEQVLTTSQCSLTVSGHLGAWQNLDGGWTVQVPYQGAIVIAYSTSDGTAGAVLNWPGNRNSDYGGPHPHQSQLQLPLHVGPEDAIIVCSTTTSPGSRGAYPYAAGGRSAVDEMMPVVFVSWPVGPGLMRPPAIGASWLARFFRSLPVPLSAIHDELVPSVIDVDSLGINWASWGAGKPTPSYAASLFSRFCGEVYGGWSTDTFTPDFQHPGYGRDLDSCVSVALLEACSTATLEERRAVIYGLCQWGFDLVGAFADGRRMIMGGGHAAGRKAPVVLLGHLLGLSALEDPSSVLGDAFQEDQCWFRAPQAWWFGWQYGWRFKPANEGPPMDGSLLRQLPTTWGDFEASSHSTFGWAVNGYLEHRCGSGIGTALAMRLMHLTRQWGTDADGMIAQFMQGPPQAAAAQLSAAGCRVVWGRDYHAGRAVGFQSACWKKYAD